MIGCIRALAALGFLACHVGAAGAAEPACAAFAFEEDAYTVCRFDPASARIAIFGSAVEGAPIGNFDRLAAMLAAQGRTLIFAMNAGMYEEDRSPVGLLVENGRQVAPLNLKSARNANFFLKPNGVFFVKDGKAAVMETPAFSASGVVPDFASQSGPMLVIRGSLHPRFKKGSRNLNRRNGVGVTRGGAVVFAISENAVNFESFARLFRDGLDCPNALYFDGAVSRLFSRDLSRNERGPDLGPIVAVSE